MLTKSQLFESIKDLPEELDREDIIERLIIIEKYNRGVQQIREGKVIPLEQIKADLIKWRRSN